MRHRVAGRHLGRETSHRLSLYRNLVTDLLRYERITTTQAKAKEIRPMAEKVITLGRRGDLHARRQAGRIVYDTRVVRRVFDEIAPRMADRPGGYLRITSLEPRKGDGAKMATIELVDYVQAPPTPRPERVTAAPAPAPVAATATPALAEETAAPAAIETVEEPEAPGEEILESTDAAVESEPSAVETSDESVAEVEAGAEPGDVATDEAAAESGQEEDAADE